MLSEKVRERDREDRLRGGGGGCQKLAKEEEKTQGNKTKRRVAAGGNRAVQRDEGGEGGVESESLGVMQVRR